MLTWFDIDQKFRGLLPDLGGLRIDVQWGQDVPEHFRLAGSYRDRDDLRRFEALARIAGEKLGQQISQLNDIPTEVTLERDPILRWYKALWHIGQSLDYDFTAYETDEDGNKLATVHAGTIPEAVKVSSTVSLMAFSKWGEPDSKITEAHDETQGAKGWGNAVLGFLAKHRDEIIVGVVVGLIVGFVLMVFSL